VRRPRRTRAILPIAVLVAAAPLLAPGSARAEATYEALANAAGVKLILTNQSVPLGVAPQVQGPTAQAKQTSLHQSDAYAAFPFPGEEVAGLPGVAGGALHLPAPAYPFLVSTTYGDDVRRLSYPGLELSSESGETITQASATGGSRGAGATSIARVARDGDAVSAGAESDADGLRLGDVLVLNGVRAVATAARDSTGKLVRSSSLSFSSLSVPGLALTVPAPPGSAGPPQKLSAPQIGFMDGNFTVAVPGAAPSTTPVPAKDVLAAFESAGYHITYQAPQETTDGIIGAGLQIATTLPAPPPGSPAGLSGQTPVTLSIGLGRAEIAYRGLSAAEAATAVPVTGVPPAVPISGPSEAPLGAGPVAPAPTTAGAPTPGFVPVSAPVELTSLTAHRAPVHSDVSWLYLAVGAVGAAGFASVLVLRVAGVRR